MSQGANMTSMAGWKWYGFPGHHCCGDRCQFHLTTSIGGRYLVSTVGRFVPDPLRKPDVTGTVGSDRLFESMVFDMTGDDENGDPQISDFNGIDMMPYNTSIDAERGHYAMCRKYQEVVQMGVKS